MSFLPIKGDHGGVPPFEYLPAAAGDYETGQLLKVTGGNLTAITADETGIPPYVCVSTRTVKSGETLAVLRVSGDWIYETTLTAAAASAAVGGKLQVASGGLGVKTGAGSFEITSLAGTAAGDIVRGRWVQAAQAASGGGGGTG